MKRWLKRTLIGVFGASALLAGFAAFSQRSGHEHGWHAMSEADVTAIKGRMIEKVGSRLDLDATQKAKFGVLVDRLHEQRNALVGNATNPRAELQSLIAGPAFDRAKAQALVEAKTAAVTGKAPEVIAALGDFYDSLRPDQQAKVREILSQGHGAWHRG